MLELLKPVVVVLQLLLLLIRLLLLLLDLIQHRRDDAQGGRGVAHGANVLARGARVGVRFPPLCSSSLHTLACQDEAVAATSLRIILRARVANEAPRPRGRTITARSLRRPALPLSSARAQARRQSWPPPHFQATPAPTITTLRPPPFTKPT